MKKLTLVLIACLAILLGWGSPASSAPPAAPTVAQAAAPTGTLMIGDSTTVRVTPRLSEQHPDWTIDGQSGRPIRALPNRLEVYLRDNPAPKTFIMALGTNHSPKSPWTQARLEAALNKLPASTDVFLMLVVRAGSFQAYKDVDLKQYNKYSRAVAAKRPNTWTVNWRGLVLGDPTLNDQTGKSSLLEDGTHQTGGTHGRGPLTPGPGCRKYAQLINEAIARAA